MPGTGHAILSPHDLASFQPDLVIVMNTVYRDEIARDLSTLGLSPEIVTLDA